MNPEGTDAIELEEVVEGAASDRDDEAEHLSDRQKELEKKPAEVVARQLVTWIRDKGLNITLEILGGDSIARNTGWRAGIISWIEKIGHWWCSRIVCWCRINQCTTAARTWVFPRTGIRTLIR